MEQKHNSYGSRRRQDFRAQSIPCMILGSLTSRIGLQISNFQVGAGENEISGSMLMKSLWQYPSTTEAIALAAWQTKLRPFTVILYGTIFVSRPMCTRLAYTCVFTGQVTGHSITIFFSKPLYKIMISSACREFS